MITPITGGRNNQAFRLDDPVFIKRYFQDDKRRLEREWAFVNLCWENGLISAPEPIGVHGGRNEAVYLFVEGERPQVVQDRHIFAALAFIRGLQGIRSNNPEGIDQFRPAVESAFSYRQHFENTQKRLSVLNDLAADDLIVIQEDYIYYVNRLYVDGPIDEGLVDVANTILSPSDFGFHNAIDRADGRGLVFVDFEYSGWDDPAKLVCDFFCQPEVPVPMKYFSQFTNGIADMLPDPVEFMERVRLLFPLYQIKWCALVLNGLGEDGANRRAFAGAQEDKEKQIALAQSMIDGLSEKMKIVEEVCRGRA